MVFVVVHLFICFLSCSFKNNRKEGTYLKDQQHQTNYKKSLKKMYFLPNCTVFYFYSRYFQPSADATYVKGAVTFIIVFSLCCMTSLVVAISLPPVCDVTMGEDDAEPLTGTTSPASPRALPSAERPLLPSSGCRLQLPL